jgi:putative DNA primase/helicase
VAIIGDARLGRTTDPQVIVERLLSISGEDQLTIPRKYLSDWTGTLRVRVVAISNLLLKILDASGAFTSRLIIFVLRNSFLGKEDPELTAKLSAELAGILNWSLDGLDRLRDRGHLAEPPSSSAVREHMEDLAAPITAFVRDCCVVAPDLEVNKDTLYEAFRQWCLGQGRTPSDKGSFGKDLIAAYPHVVTARPRVDGERECVYRGLTLR